MVIAAPVIIVLIIGGYLGYQQYAEDHSRSERISSLMEYVNTTDYTKASLFDEKYNYLAVEEKYNQSVLDFFSYWFLNQSLAETSLEILRSIDEANRYLSRLDVYVVNYGSKDNLTLVLSALTDKNEYSAGDEINYTIIVLSNSDLGKVPITIFGFKNRYGAYKVDNKWIKGTSLIEINVKTGLNVESFSIDIPCSPCYGVDPGLHNLTCVIRYNGLNVNVTKYIVFR
ncbi:MAG: hypothetical protein QXF52_09825 [Thermoproteota archaeon]